MLLHFCAVRCPPIQLQHQCQTKHVKLDYYCSFGHLRFNPLETLRGASRKITWARGFPQKILRKSGVLRRIHGA